MDNEQTINNKPFDNLATSSMDELKQFDVVEEAPFQIPSGTTPHVNTSVLEESESVEQETVKQEVVESEAPAPATPSLKPFNVTPTENKTKSVAGIGNVKPFVPTEGTMHLLPNTKAVDKAVKQGYTFKNYTPEEYLYAKQSVSEVWGRTLANIPVNAATDIVESITLGAIDLEKYKNVFGEVFQDPNGDSFNFKSAAWWASGAGDVASSALSMMTVSSGVARNVKPLFESTKRFANMFRKIDADSVVSLGKAALREQGYITKATSIVAGFVGGYAEGLMMAKESSKIRFDKLVAAGYTSTQAAEITSQAFQTEVLTNALLLGLSNTIQIQSLSKVFGSIHSPTLVKTKELFKNMLHEGFEESVLNSLSTTVAEYRTGLTDDQLKAYVKGEEYDSSLNGLINEYKNKLSELSTWEEGFFGLFGGLIELSNIRPDNNYTYNPKTGLFDRKASPDEQFLDRARKADIMKNQVALAAYRGIEYNRFSNYGDGLKDKNSVIAFTVNDDGSLNERGREATPENLDNTISHEQASAMLEVQAVELYKGHTYEEYLAVAGQYSFAPIMSRERYETITDMLNDFDRIVVAQNLASKDSNEAARSTITNLLTEQAIASINDPEFITMLQDFVTANKDTLDTLKALSKLESITDSKVKREIQGTLLKLKYNTRPASNLEKFEMATLSAATSKYKNYKETKTSSSTPGKIVRPNKLANVTSVFNKMKYKTETKGSITKITKKGELVLLYNERSGERLVLEVGPAIDSYYKDGLLTNGMLDLIKPLYDSLPDTSIVKKNILQSVVGGAPRSETQSLNLELFTKATVDEWIEYLKKTNPRVESAKLEKMRPLYNMYHSLMNDGKPINQKDLLSILDKAIFELEDSHALQLIRFQLSSPMYADHTYSFVLSNKTTTSSGFNSKTHDFNKSISNTEFKISINPNLLIKTESVYSGGNFIDNSYDINQSSFLSNFAHEMLHVVNTKFIPSNSVKMRDTVKYAEAVRKIFKHYLPDTRFFSNAGSSPAYSSFHKECRTNYDAVRILSETMSYSTSIAMLRRYSEIDLDQALADNVITREEYNLMQTYAKAGKQTSNVKSFLRAFLEFIAKLLNIDRSQINDLMFSLAKAQSDIVQLNKKDRFSKAPPTLNVIENTVDKNANSAVIELFDKQADESLAVTDDDLIILNEFNVNEVNTNLTKQRWYCTIPVKEDAGGLTYKNNLIKSIYNKAIRISDGVDVYDVDPMIVNKIFINLTNNSQVLVKDDNFHETFKVFDSNNQELNVADVDPQIVIDAIIKQTNLNLLVEANNDSLIIELIKKYLDQISYLDKIDSEEVNFRIRQALSDSLIDTKSKLKIQPNLFTYAIVGETSRNEKTGQTKYNIFHESIAGAEIITYASDTRTYNFVKFDILEKFRLQEETNYTGHGGGGTYLGIVTPNMIDGKSRFRFESIKNSQPVHGPATLSIGTPPTLSNVVNRGADKETVKLFEMFESQRKTFLSMLNSKMVDGVSLNNIVITDIKPGIFNFTSGSSKLKDSKREVEHTKVFVHDGTPVSLDFKSGKTVNINGTQIEQYSPPPELLHWKNMDGALMLALPYASFSTKSGKDYLYRVVLVDTLRLQHFRDINNTTFIEAVNKDLSKIAMLFGASINSQNKVDSVDNVCDVLESKIKSQFLTKDFASKSESLMLTSLYESDVDTLTMSMYSATSDYKTLPRFYNSKASKKIKSNNFAIIVPSNTNSDKMGFFYLNKFTGQAHCKIVNKQTKETNVFEASPRILNMSYEDAIFEMLSAFVEILPLRLNTNDNTAAQDLIDNNYHLDKLEAIVPSVVEPFDKKEFGFKTWSINDTVNYGFEVINDGMRKILPLDSVMKIVFGIQDVSDFFKDNISQFNLAESINVGLSIDDEIAVDNNNVITPTPVVNNTVVVDTTTPTADTLSKIDLIFDSNDEYFSVTDDSIIPGETVPELSPLVSKYNDAINDAKLIVDLGVVDDGITQFVKNLLRTGFQSSMATLPDSSNTSIAASVVYAIKYADSKINELGLNEHKEIKQLFDRIEENRLAFVFDTLRRDTSNRFSVIKDIENIEVLDGEVIKFGSVIKHKVAKYATQNNLSVEEVYVQIEDAAKALGAHAPSVENLSYYLIQNTFRSKGAGFNKYSFLNTDSFILPKIFSIINNPSKDESKAIHELSMRHKDLFRVNQLKAAKKNVLYSSAFEQTNVESASSVQEHLFDNITVFNNEFDELDVYSVGRPVSITDMIKEFIGLSQFDMTPEDTLNRIKDLARWTPRITLSPEQVRKLTELSDSDYAMFVLNNVAKDTYKYDSSNPGNSTIQLKNKWDFVLDRLYDLKTVKVNGSFSREKLFSDKIDNTIVDKTDPSKTIHSNLNNRNLNSLFSLIQQKYNIYDVKRDANGNLVDKYNKPMYAFYGIRLHLIECLSQIPSLFYPSESLGGAKILNPDNINMLKIGIPLNTEQQKQYGIPYLSLSSSALTANNIELYINTIFNTNIKLSNPAITLHMLRLIAETNYHSKKVETFVNAINDIANKVNSINSSISKGYQVGRHNPNIASLYSALIATSGFLDYFVYTKDGNKKATVTNGNALSDKIIEMMDKDYLRKNVITQPNFDKMFMSKAVFDYLADPTSDPNNPALGNQLVFMERLAYTYIESLSTEEWMDPLAIKKRNDVSKVKFKTISSAERRAFNKTLKLTDEIIASEIEKLNDRVDLSGNTSHIIDDVDQETRSFTEPVEVVEEYEEAYEDMTQLESIDESEYLEEVGIDGFEYSSSPKQKAKRKYKERELFTKTVTLAAATVKELSEFVVSSLVPTAKDFTNWLFPTQADKSRTDAFKIDVLKEAITTDNLLKFVETGDPTLLDNDFIWNNVIKPELEFVRLNYQSLLKGLKEPTLHYWASNSVFYVNPWFNNKLDLLYVRDIDNNLTLNGDVLQDLVKSFLDNTNRELKNIEDSMITNGSIKVNEDGSKLFDFKVSIDYTIDGIDKIMTSTSSVLTHVYFTDKAVTSNMFNFNLGRVGSSAKVTPDKLKNITPAYINSIFKNYEKRLQLHSSPKSRTRRGVAQYLVIDDVVSHDTSYDNIVEFIDNNPNLAGIENFVNGTPSKKTTSSNKFDKPGLIEENTNGQTYITYASSVKDAYYKGSLEKHQAIVLLKDYFNQPLTDNEKADVEAYQDLLQISVEKPLCSGLVNTVVEGVPVQYMVYNKSSDLVLDKAFTKLTSLREFLEKEEVSSAGNDIEAFLEDSVLRLATFPSSLKCGAPTVNSKLQMKNGSLTLDFKEGSIVKLPANFRGIQVATHEATDENLVTNTSAFSGIVAEGNDDQIIIPSHINKAGKRVQAKTLKDFRADEIKLLNDLTNLQIEQALKYFNDPVELKNRIADQIEILNPNDNNDIRNHVRQDDFYDYVVNKFGISVLNTAIRTITNQTVLVDKVYGFTAKLASGTASLFDPNIGFTEEELKNKVQGVILTQHAEQIDGKYTGNFKPIKFHGTGDQRCNVSQAVVSNEFVVINDKGKETRLNLEEKDNDGNYKYLEFVQTVDNNRYYADSKPRGYLRLKEGVLSDNALTIIGSRVPTQGPSFIATSQIAGILPQRVRSVAMLDNRLLETVGHDFDFDSWFTRLSVLFNKGDNSFNRSNHMYLKETLLNKLLDVYIDVDTSNNPKRVLDKNIPATNPNVDEIGGKLAVTGAAPLDYFNFYYQQKLRAANFIYKDGIGFFAFLRNSWGLLSRANKGFTDELGPIYQLGSSEPRPRHLTGANTPDLFLFGEKMTSVDHTFKDSVAPSVMLSEWLNNFVDFVKSANLTNLNLPASAFSGVAGLSMFAPKNILSAMLTNDVVQSWFKEASIQQSSVDESLKGRLLDNLIKNIVETNKVILNKMFAPGSTLPYKELFKSIPEFNKLVVGMEVLHSRQKKGKFSKPTNGEILNLLHAPTALMRLDMTSVQDYYVNLLNVSIDKINEGRPIKLTNDEVQAILVFKEYIIGNTWILASSQCSSIMSIGKKLRFPAKKLENDTRSLTTYISYGNNLIANYSSFFSKNAYSLVSYLKDPKSLMSNGSEYTNLRALRLANKVYTKLWTVAGLDKMKTFLFLEGIRQKYNLTETVVDLYKELTNLKYKAEPYSNRISKPIPGNSIDSYELCANTEHFFYKAYSRLKSFSNNDVFKNNFSETTMYVNGSLAWVPIINPNTDESSKTTIANYINNLIKYPMVLSQNTGYTSRDFIIDLISLEIQSELFMKHKSIYKFLNDDSIKNIRLNEHLALTDVSLFKDGIFETQTFVKLLNHLNRDVDVRTINHKFDVREHVTVLPDPFIVVGSRYSKKEYRLQTFNVTSDGLFSCSYAPIEANSVSIYNDVNRYMTRQQLSIIDKHLNRLSLANKDVRDEDKHRRAMTTKFKNVLQNKKGFYINETFTGDDLKNLSLRDIFALYTFVKPAPLTTVDMENELRDKLVTHLTKETISDTNKTSLYRYMLDNSWYVPKTLRDIIYFASLDKTLWEPTALFLVNNNPELYLSISDELGLKYNVGSNYDKLNVNYDVRLNGKNDESTLVSLNNFLKNKKVAKFVSFDPNYTVTAETIAFNLSDNRLAQIKRVLDSIPNRDENALLENEEFISILSFFNIKNKAELQLFLSTYDTVSANIEKDDAKPVVNLTNVDNTNDFVDEALSVTEDDIIKLEMSNSTKDVVKEYLLDRQALVKNTFKQIESNSYTSIRTLSDKLSIVKSKIIDIDSKHSEEDIAQNSALRSVRDEHVKTRDLLAEQLQSLSNLQASFKIAENYMVGSNSDITRILKGSFQLVNSIKRELDRKLLSSTVSMPIGALTANISALRNMIGELNVMFKNEMNEIVVHDPGLSKYKSSDKSNQISDYVLTLTNEATRLIDQLETYSLELLSNTNAKNFVNSDIGSLGAFTNMFMSIKSTKDKFAHDFARVIEHLESEMSVLADTAKTKYNSVIKRLKSRNVSFEILMRQGTKGFVLNRMLNQEFYDYIKEFDSKGGEGKLSLVMNNDMLDHINPFHLNIDMLVYLHDHDLIDFDTFDNLYTNFAKNSENAEKELLQVMTKSELNKLKLSIRTNTDTTIAFLTTVFENYTGSNPMTAVPINSIYNEVFGYHPSMSQGPVYLNETSVNDGKMSMDEFNVLRKYIIMDTLLKDSFYYKFVIDSVHEGGGRNLYRNPQLMIDSIRFNKYITLFKPRFDKSTSWINHELIEALQDEDLNDLYGMLYDISSYFSQNNVYEYYMPVTLPFASATITGLKDSLTKLINKNQIKIKVEEMFSDMTSANKQYNHFKSNDYATLYSFNANQTFNTIKIKLLENKLSELDEEYMKGGMSEDEFQQKYKQITDTVTKTVFDEFGDIELNNMDALIGVYYSMVYRNILADELISFKHVANSVNQSDLSLEQTRLVEKIKSDVDSKLSKLQLFSEVSRTNNTDHKQETINKLKEVRMKIYTQRDILLTANVELVEYEKLQLHEYNKQLTEIDSILSNTSEFNITKVAQNIITVNSFLVLGFNVRSWVNNYIGGMATNFIHAIDTPNYNASDYNYAIKQAWAGALGVFKLNTVNKPYWNKIRRLQERYRLLSTKSNELMLNNDLINQGAYFGSSNGEQIIQSPPVYAVLKKHTIKFGNSSTSLWDLTTEDGLFDETKVPVEHRITVSNQYSKLMTEAGIVIVDAIKKAQGDYYNNLPTKARQLIIGRLVMSLRSFVFSTIYDAYKSDVNVDVVGGESYVESGYMRSIAKLMGRRFDHSKGMSRMGAIAKGAGILAANMLVTTATLGKIDIGLDKYLTIDGKVSVGDKVATLKMFKFYRVVLMLGLILYLIKQIDGDEEDDNTILVRNMVYGMQDQLLVYSDPNRMLDLIKQPSSTISFADKLIKTGDLLFNLLNGNDVYRNGATDASRLQEHVGKQVPIWNTVKYRIPNWINVDYENAERYGNAGSRSNRK